MVRARLVAAQSGDRRDDQDAAVPSRDHRALADQLREQEHAGEVQVQQLLPRLERVLRHRRSPGRAGVVDEDVAVAQLAERSVDEGDHRLGLAQIRGNRVRAHALLGEMGDRFVQFGLFSRGEHDLGAHLAERLGDLQPQPARAAGDDRLAPGQAHRFAYRHRTLSFRRSRTVRRHPFRRRCTS